MKNIIKKLFLIITVTTIGMSKVHATTTIDCNQTLKYNSINEQVKILQTELNTTTKCNLDVDGIFGTKTKSCVTQFQKKYDLEQDGIVGSNTCTKLNTAYKKELRKNYVVITAEELNVRKNAGTNYAIKGTVKRGNVFRIYNKKKVGNTTWYKIKVNQNHNPYYGYVSGEYAKKNAILLNITTQKLTYYKKGKVLMDVPVITGVLGKHDTPTGHYSLKVQNKINGTTLTGNNDDGSRYNAYVNYWMPFIPERGIGFHDASWRSTNEFNSETYQYNGSHGCVNMKTEDAKKLYENTTKDTDVIVIK